MTSLYDQRRHALMNALPDDSFVLLAGYQQKVRSKNIKYHFRQDNDFLYLTDFNEPDAVALLYKDSHDQIHYTLLCRPKDSAQEVSFGERAGVEGAVTKYGATAAYDIAELETVIGEQLTDQHHLFISDELGRFKDKKRRKEKYTIKEKIKK